MTVKGPGIGEPPGWREYISARPPRKTGIRPRALADLVRVNQGLNSQKLRETNALEWRARGGCTQYVVEKRECLIALGYDERFLLPVTCATEGSPYADHAVLLVNMTDGEFVLDNNAPDVKPWHYLPYRWVVRLSADGARWDLVGG